MTSTISEAELMEMDRRFKEMNRKDAIAKARREQAKRVRPVKVHKPAVKSAPVATPSAISRQMVAEVHAGNAAATAARNVRAANTGTPAFWIDWHAIIPAPGGKTVLLRVVGVDGDSIFAKAVKGNGESMPGVPLATLNAASSVKGGWNLFETLADAHAFADSEGLTLVGRT